MSSANNSLHICWNSSAFDVSLNWTTVITLPLINIAVLFGNILVILTVLCSKRMRNTWSNVFIISLAFSDLLLGFFVLPLSVITQITDIWLYGEILCRLWLTADVWLCTASIYNLLIIAIDRFVAVTKPLSYKTVLTSKRVSLMITGAWLLSLIVGLPLVFIERQELAQCQCSHMMNTSSYIVGSSIFSFYLPFVIISYFYFRIYKRVRCVKSALNNGFIEICASSVYQLPAAANQQTALLLTLSNAKKKFEHSPSSSVIDSTNSTVTTYSPSLQNFRQNLRVHKGGYCTTAETVALQKPRQSIVATRLSSGYGSQKGDQEEARPRSQTWEPPNKAPLLGQFKRPRFFTNSIRRVEPGNKYGSGNNLRSENPVNYSPKPPMNAADKRRISVLGIKYCETSIAKYQKRLGLELRALKTVGVVTGCFLICWFGFCFMYAFHAFHDTQASSMLVSVAVWLGYSNSAFNPFIYAVCNKQYRNNFKNLWCRCGKHRKMRRSSSFSMTSNYRRASCIMETSIA